MNGKYTRIVGCLVTIALIIMGIQKLDYLVRPTDTDGSYRRIEAFHSLPEESVEVMIFGSSHAFLGVNTMELYNKYGIGAYNYGANWQKINTVKLFMSDSFRTQTPKLAIIDTFFAGTVLQNTSITGEIFYVRYIENSKAKTHYLKQCFGNDPAKWLSFYMPLYAFHDNWNSLTQTSFLPLTEGKGVSSMEEIRENMGYAPYDTVTKVTVPDQSTAEQKAFSKAAIKELDDIVEMCRAEGTEILFITLPYKNPYPNADAMAEYVKGKGCTYINLYDYLDEIGINGNTDFKDVDHLNNNGATKVADFLGQYIVNHYQLNDMRKDDNNLWQQGCNT